MRRLFRSLSFWLGLPGFLFLLWAWRDSEAHFTTLRFEGKPGIQLRQHHSKLEFVAWSNSQHHGAPRFECHRFPVRDDEHSNLRADLLAEVDLAWLVNQDENIREAIPYWQPVSAYLLIWAGVLVWRSRRYLKTLASLGRRA